MSGDAANGWLAAPTWLDAKSLRVLLDDLRAGLARPLVANRFGGETILHDRDAIAASLRELLSRLERVDLAASRAVSGVVHEFRPESQAAKLRAFFDTLKEALRDRVLSVLGPAKVVAVARLLRSPAPDVLRMLGREDDENSHSDLIAWLLTPRKAPIVALHALRELTSELEDAHRWAACLADAVADDSVSVRREMVVARELANADDLCRVDIVVTGPGFILAIENKVWSSEHGDQTRTYWAWLETCPGLRGGLFLSPAGVSPSSSSFRALSYLDLVAALTEGPTRAALTESEEIVLASYLKTLARYVIPVEMRAVLDAAANLEGT